jgi:hypothetical protein
MPSELAIVAELCSPLEAVMLKERLEAGGIECYLDNSQVAEAFGQIDALGGVRIRVAAADRERAQQIIEAARQRSEKEATPSTPRKLWTCLQCGEPVPNDFMTCWSCGASREGVPDPAFRHADAGPVQEREVHRDSADSTRMRSTAALILLVVGTLFFLTDASRGTSQWHLIATWLGCWAMALLVWRWK